MRITGGEWRSRRLLGPKRSMPLRPTPDAMRERAFAVLGDRLNNARFLDLFAGTGSVGLEALSRGARSAVFVENHHAAARLVRANCDSLCIDPSRLRLIVRPALKAVHELAAQGDLFDLVWADPPFESWRDGLDALAAVRTLGLLAPNGLACLECPEKAGIAASLPADLQINRDLTGGAFDPIAGTGGHIGIVMEEDGTAQPPLERRTERESLES